MPRREALFLADLVESIRDVAAFLDEATRERWDHDRVLQSAVLHKMMIIGEIARALPEELRDRHTDVPWRQMRGFRNIAVHQYFAIDWAVVWKIATQDVPKLETQALNILRAEFPDVAKRYEHTADRHAGHDDTPT